MPVELIFRLLAVELGIYPSSLQALKIISFNSFDTYPLLFIALETVAVETPHLLATSLIVVFPHIFGNLSFRTDMKILISMGYILI